MLGPNGRKQISYLGNQFKMNQKKSLNFKIARICKGQMFGQEDVINDRNYTTSVKCVSNSGKLFMIKSDEFYQRIKKDDLSKDILMNVSYEKDVRTKTKIIMACQNYI